MLTYFVSGHLDLTEAEFEEHYVPALNQGVREGAGFIVGDARGADLMAQEYLLHAGGNVKVFHMFTKPRNLASPDIPTVGGFHSDQERDKAMTRASTADIAWIRPGREKSGTAKNLKRRKVQLV